VTTATETAIAEIRGSKPLAKQAKRILELVRPHIRFEPRKGKAADNKPGASRLGGEPDLPPGTAWPIGPGWNGDAPMDFIAQIDLDAVARRDVDGVLPTSGVLAFFVAQNYDTCAVIHGDHDTVARVASPVPRRRRSAKPPKWGGFDVSADIVLPPPWSAFVSSKTRSSSAYSSRTGTTGRGKTLVELSPEAHEAYCEIYERWIEAVGYEQHGMLGYERMMENAQTRDELVLLRIDNNGFTGTYDFVEVVSIYWFITEDALVARKFDDVSVLCGSTI
jgi:uncharacterized protein YwqG